MCVVVLLPPSQVELGALQWPAAVLPSPAPDPDPDHPLPLIPDYYAHSLRPTRRRPEDFCAPWLCCLAAGRQENCVCNRTGSRSSVNPFQEQQQKNTEEKENERTGALRTVRSRSVLPAQVF